MRSQHTNFKPAFTNETIAQVIDTLSCDVFIYSHLSTRHHIFDCSGKFIHFQQKKNLTLQFIQNFNDFFMILSSFLHNLLFICGRIQIKDVSCFVIKLVISFAGKHQKQQFWISCPQFSCSYFIMLGIIQNQSQPKLIIAFYKLMVKFLVKAVVKQDKLIFFVIQLPDHQIATMSISMHKALFMDHLYDHIRKQFADFFSIYTHLLQFIDFIDMHTVNILHYQHSLCGFEIYIRDIYIFEVILLQKSLSTLHVSGFMHEIQLKFQVLLELLYEPFIAKVREQPQSNIDEFSHHLQIFSYMAHQMSMLNLNSHFLSIQKLSLMNLTNRRRRNRLLIEAFEDNLNRITHIFFDCCFYFRKRGNFTLSSQS